MSSLPMLKSGMSSVVTIAIFLMFKYSLLWYFLFSLSWEVVPNHCYFLPLRWCYLHILSDWYFLNQFSLFLPESSPVFFYDTFCIQSKQMKRQNAPLLTPLPTGNCSVSPYSVLAVASCPWYRSHIRTIKCWGMPVFFRAGYSIYGTILKNGKNNIASKLTLRKETCLLNQN